MILVYTHKISTRLEYILQLLLKELLGVDFSLTENKNEFENSLLPKFSYSKNKVGNELHFESVDLLFENEIHPPRTDVFIYNEVEYLFSPNSPSLMPFDLFASAFYLVSRYEEYLPFKEDQYGRFEAAESFQFKKNILQKPLVNEYAQQLKNILNEKFSDLKFNEPKYQFISTIDVDNAFAFKHKGFARTTGALMRSLLKFDFKSLSQRIDVLTGKTPDPFDTYKFLQEIHFSKKLKPKIFYLLGDLNKYDRNVSHSNENVQQLIRNNDYWAESCIHPSFQSNQNRELILIEKERLEKITGRKVTKSRQHFLKMKFPETFVNLINAGIKEDYSMSFATEAGFRAGICSPFYFFNLKENQATQLKIFPVTIMDSTLNSYMKLSPVDAIDRIKKLMSTVKRYNGTFINLWHNETVSDQGIWMGWKKVFEKSLEFAETTEE